MKYLFSIAILTYNGEKTIDNLLKKLLVISRKYNTETIVIDSESTDNTLDIVKRYIKKIPNLKIIKIKKKDFNHGETRNLAVRAAKGKYICFYSQDAIPNSISVLKYYQEDFKLNNKVVVVFGKHIPYKDTPIIQKLDVLCQWEKIDKYSDNKGILLQSLTNPFIPYIEQNKVLWYALSDTASCYKRSFLLSHPFPKTEYGEDLLIGKKIIESGFTKIYDQRCNVLHSHKFNIWQYYLRVKADFIIKYHVLKLRDRSSFLQKFKLILSFNDSIIRKGLNIFRLFFYYLIKGVILINLKFSK